MTILGRSKLDHPSLGTSGGSTLHAQIENIFTKLSDNISGRFFSYASQSNSNVITIEHGYGVAFSELKILLYSGTYPSLTRISDPTGSGWSIVATPSYLTTKRNVTCPSTGGPHTFAIMILQGRGSEKLTELDDIDFTTTSPTNLKFLQYNSVTSKWIPTHLSYATESASISSNKITPTTGTPIQRITGTAADLYTIGGATTGKFLILVNETSANIIIKNEAASGTVSEKILTGTGADVTLKNQAAIGLIYNSTLSRWMLVGGSGSGGLQPEAKSTSFTAEAGKYYLVDTTSAMVTATLPAGLAGSSIKFADAYETWATNSLRITPNGSEQIDNL